MSFETVNLISIYYGCFEAFFYWTQLLISHFDFAIPVPSSRF